ncbi:MAG: hypothetical protein WKF43_04790 [Acidimicrobiales bacterium]
MNGRELGLRVGEIVRFRRRLDQRWREGSFVGVQRDGSIGLRDADGAFCAIVAEHIEARSVGPMGGATWKPLVARIARAEQLELF